MNNARIFNPRVYGILLNEAKTHVVVTDEFIQGVSMTKFIGGGLEFGEGTIDCLKREFMEECGIRIDIEKHFYTTDFFVPSAFNKASQVLSIYYVISTQELNKLPFTDKVFDFQDGKNQSFRLISLHDISENDFTFAIDKHVANLLHINKI